MAELDGMPPETLTDPRAASTLEQRLADYRPTEYVDFSDSDAARRMREALAQVAGELGRDYPCRVGGEDVRQGATRPSTNPADPDQVIGTFPTGDEALAERAIAAAAVAFESWKTVEPAERADILFRGAEIMRRRRLELAAWMVYEVGKSWGEADGDVAEAIDFLDYYARCMLHYAYDPYPLADYPSEENRVIYLPLGVGVIIPPWNFPLAILAGMTSAAIVAGNTVVVKPASEAMTIGYKFVEVMEEAGLPPGVFNFVTGPGEVIGRVLVDHPLTRFVSFTGSKAVGLDINARAAEPRSGQRWIKRVVAEMGGKDAIIVDSEADLDAAVEGVTLAAFGFQGQKCSACSLAVVAADRYDDFLRGLVARAGRIVPGDVTEGAWMGPVVSKSQFATVSEYIEVGKEEGTLVLGGRPLERKGYFIPPTIFADVQPGARIAREEIFGPVLAVIKARDFDEALAIANASEYGLTGAVYTADPEKIERAEREFHVGNLYINRKCTGALVGVHPFGGFNMSGTDSKAGGRDYLLLFLQPKSIARKKDV
ncbi:MAG: L-glutamate gamma-semialdehyde dehydrogenase [Gemmatimonadota bacterium]